MTNKLITYEITVNRIYTVDLIKRLSELGLTKMYIVKTKYNEDQFFFDRKEEWEIVKEIMFELIRDSTEPLLPTKRRNLFQIIFNIK